MSPTPLIELQRRLAEAGRIRMGEKTDKGAPKRLTTWRITSPTKDLIEQAAGLYGGEPREWESPTGKQWEVVTTTAELPVLVMPGYSFRQGYEHRTSPTLVERRCDGEEMDDGKPCACNATGFQGDECKLMTRLTVALPELTTMLGWRLETKGVNAAKTLLASMDLVQGVAGGRPFVPAKLRIVEKKGNKDGQAIRWVEPVIDVSIRYAEVLGGEGTSPALPAGYTPIAPVESNGVTLAQGLEVAETQTLTRRPRVELPDDDVDDDESGVPPLPQGTDADGADVTTAPQKPLSLAQCKTKLNSLVGQLRKTKHITTEQLYSALATSRKMERDDMVALMNDTAINKGLPSPRDTEGVLHWAPLRDSLTLEEARELHGRLARLWVNVQEMEKVS